MTQILVAYEASIGQFLVIIEKSLISDKFSLGFLYTCYLPAAHKLKPGLFRAYIIRANEGNFLPSFLDIYFVLFDQFFLHFGIVCLQNNLLRVIREQHAEVMWEHLSVAERTMRRYLLTFISSKDSFGPICSQNMSENVSFVDFFATAKHYHTLIGVYTLDYLLVFPFSFGKA